MSFEKSINVVTASMGSCHCGDCTCTVYSDGTVQYEGREEWQKSERHVPDFEKWRNRPYGSHISKKEYDECLAILTGGKVD
jgi:hypothetical protein